MHGEKHWLHYGGRRAGQREYPTPSELIIQALNILRPLRSNLIEAPFHYSKFKTEEEYIEYIRRPW